MTGEIQIYNDCQRDRRGESSTTMTYSGEPHALDVVQLIDDSLKASTTVDLVRCIARGCCTSIGARKPEASTSVHGFLLAWESTHLSVIT